MVDKTRRILSRGVLMIHKVEMIMVTEKQEALANQVWGRKPGVTIPQKVNIT